MMDSQEMTLGQERTEEQLNVTPGDNGTVENYGCPEIKELAESL